MRGDEHICARCVCGGLSDENGEYVVCPDDLCRGADRCIHDEWNGMAICLACSPDAPECWACMDEEQAELDALRGENDHG